MVDVLEELGVSVKIAHPNEMKALARARSAGEPDVLWKYDFYPIPDAVIK